MLRGKYPVCMNKKYFFFPLLLLLLLACLQLSAQELPSSGSSLLQGQLLDAENKDPIPFAHITNLQRGFRALSDSSGSFKLPASEGDTLLISSVSYGQHKVLAPAKGEKLILIELAPNVYELEEVVVQSLPSERKFKEMLLGMDSPEAEKPHMRLPDGLYQEAGTGNASLSLGSPISAIAGRFSKKERGRQFAAKMEFQEERRAYIRTKFNRVIVQDITGMEEEEKLEAFMKYCVMNDDWLYKASEYEIHKAVLGCFGDFMNEQEG